MLKVEKYGGSSVSSIKQIQEISKHLKAEVDQNNKVIVVLSAMGKTTNNFLDDISEISLTPNKREVDQLLALGEMKSVCLAALCLSELQVKCISLTAKNIELKSSNDFQKGLIKSINPKIIYEYLKTYDVLFITGFQGINDDGDYVTLGRGGSDTTAVALAAILDVPCYIYTDVDGVHSMDPNVISTAKKYKQMPYDIMMEMASLGSKVLSTRSVILAYKYNLELYLAKTLNKEGTKIVRNVLEQEDILGVSKMNGLILLKFHKKHYLEIIDKLLNIKYDMFNINEEIVSFIINEEDFKIIKDITEDFEYYINISKISLVGYGISSKGNTFSKVLNLLIKNNIDISYITTSELSISFIVKDENIIDVISELAKCFDLLD